MQGSLWCRTQPSRSGAGRVVKIVIDADDNVQNIPNLNRRRDNNALGTAIEVALNRLRGQEFAGAFKHEFDTQIAPGIPADVGCAVKRRWRLPIRIDDSPTASISSRHRPCTESNCRRCRRRRRSSLDFVQVNDFQPVGLTRIV